MALLVTVWHACSGESLRWPHYPHYILYYRMFHLKHTTRVQGTQISTEQVPRFVRTLGCATADLSWFQSGPTHLIRSLHPDLPQQRCRRPTWGYTVTLVNEMNFVIPDIPVDQCWSSAFFFYRILFDQCFDQCTLKGRCLRVQRGSLLPSPGPPPSTARAHRPAAAFALELAPKSG